MNETEIFNKRVESIQKILEENYRNLDKIKEMLLTLGKDLKRDVYKNTEGIVGIFDGVHLTDTNGNKYDVPANYAAKSRLVYGDTIKMIEEDGAPIFKQIQKVERKKTEGVLSKKEGKWVVLTDTGSYRVSDVAVDFNQGQMNDEVIVFIPATNLNAPYATLDRLVKPRLPEHKNAVIADKQPKQVQAPIQAPKPRAATPEPKPAGSPKPSAASSAPKPARPSQPSPAAQKTPADLPIPTRPNTQGDTISEISPSSSSSPSSGGGTTRTGNPLLDDDDLR